MTVYDEMIKELKKISENGTKILKKQGEYSEQLEEIQVAIRLLKKTIQANNVIFRDSTNLLRRLVQEKEMGGCVKVKDCESKGVENGRK